MNDLCAEQTKTFKEVKLKRKENIKRIKGEMYFVYEDGEIKTYQRDLEEWQKGTGIEDCTIYDLINGKDFVDSIKCGGFTDYDGSIADIFINDYITNLGIWADNFHKGKGFYVSLEDFLEICNDAKVEVNWANK